MYFKKIKTLLKVWRSQTNFLRKINIIFYTIIESKI